MWSVYQQTRISAIRIALAIKIQNCLRNSLGQFSFSIMNNDIHLMYTPVNINPILLIVSAGTLQSLGIYTTPVKTVLLTSASEFV